MTITVSLLITLATLLLFGGWTLISAIGHADEGYEDAFGFSFGLLPSASPYFSQPFQSAPVKTAPATHQSASAADSVADTMTQGGDAASESGRGASALYRRHRRSTSSTAPFAPPATSSSSTGSASPFAIQCAVTRARANQTDTTSPFPVSNKTMFGDGAAL